MNPTPPKPPADALPDVKATPRTEKECVLCNYGSVRVTADFARQLERELLQKTQLLAEAQDYLVQSIDHAKVGWGRAAQLETELRSSEAALAEAKAEAEEQNLAFDLHHAAEQRGIKRWRDAHPGKELTLPDTADFTFWLIHELTALRAILDRTAKEAFGLDDTIGLEPYDDYFIRQVAKLRANAQEDSRLMDFLDRSRTYYSHPPMRMVTGWQWRIIDETGAQNIRQAIRAAMSSAARNGGEGEKVL